MRKRGHFILPVVFTAILILPVIAIAVLQVGQACIKFTRQDRLETENLVQVTVPADKLIWEEEGKELWVGDKMFDVSEYFIKDGNYYLTGAFDEGETEVAGLLSNAVSSRTGISLLQLLILLQYFSISAFIIEFALKHATRKKEIALPFILFPFPFFPVLAPPPRR